MQKRKTMLPLARGFLFIFFVGRCCRCVDSFPAPASLGSGARHGSSKRGGQFGLKITPSTDNSIRKAGTALGQLMVGSPDSALMLGDEVPKSRIQTLRKDVREFANRNFFVLGMVFAVTLARIFPQLGVDNGVLRPELFIGKYGVTAIFLLSGLSLELTELRNAATHHEIGKPFDDISGSARTRTRA